MPLIQEWISVTYIEHYAEIILGYNSVTNYKLIDSSVKMYLTGVTR